MKKRFLALLVLIFLVFVPFVPTFAASSNGTPRVTDDADLLSDSEEKQLEDKLEKISKKYKCDVIIVTKESIGNGDAGEYADKFFKDNGFGIGKTKNGISLVLGMNGEPGNRPFDITAHSTSKKKGAQKIFNITKRTDIINSIGDDLHNGNYYAAFDGYANLVEKYLKQYKMKKIASVPISILIAFVISLIIMGGQKATLKSVHTQPAARSYLVTSNVSGNDMQTGIANNAGNVTGKVAGGVAAGVAAGIILSMCTDQFMYSNVKKTPRQSSSGGGSISHSSGSGYSSSRGKF
ncbi:MAG: TPM domain-containing protein [Lachnospiraceae bacterium]|nr:TPM domain-containing protein [Lachnospiraceae bacterium]MBQ9233128.1 TPM domain-containing protein [Lachnospiraceae bacterium]